MDKYVLKERIKKYMIVHSSCGDRHHQSLDLVPSSQVGPGQETLSHRERAEVRHLHSFKDEAFGTPGAGFTIFLLSLGLWQHFLSLLHRGALLLGVAQHVAGTCGDGIGHCPAWPQLCEPRCFIWGYERAHP